MANFSRRRALSGILAAPVLAGGCGPISQSRGVKALDVLQIGANGRIRGVNITPGPADWGGASPWAELWSRWDWNGRIKNELDDAVEVGANCVRLIGNTHAITSGAINEDDYAQRWTQFLNYTRERGLWVYPCGGDLSHWGDTALADAEDIYQGWAEVVAKADHVIGVDITNEAPAQSRIAGGIAYHEPESWFYTVQRLGERVKAVTKKPITHSRSVASAGASWQFGSPETDALSDFIDLHVYANSTTENIDSLLATDWGAGKQFIFGEFGVDMTNDSKSRTAFYEHVKSLIGYSPQCVGGLAWAMYDGGTIPVSQPGLYDANRVARSDIVTPFVTLPTTR